MLIPPPALAGALVVGARHNVPPAGLLALPVADTVKEAEPVAGPARVAGTLPRGHLWQARTPQMFRAGRLPEAFATAAREGNVPTDEAGAIEPDGHRPLLVTVAPANAKVTCPHDFS